MRKKQPGWITGALLVSASIAWLCGHIMMWWGRVSVGMPEWTALGIAGAGTQWALPAFFACLTATLFHTDYALGPAAVFKRLLPRALLTAAFWWLACAAVWMQNNYPNELDPQTFWQCMGEVLEQPVGMRLFLALVSAVILYPLLWRVVRHRQIRRYCMLLFFLFAFINPLLKLVPYVSAVTMLTDQLNWGYFTAWGFYILLGSEILRETHTPWARTLMMAGGLAAFGLAYAATSWMTSAAPGFYDDFLGVASPLTALETAGALTLFKTLIRDGRGCRLERLSSVTLGSLPAAYLMETLIGTFVPLNESGPLLQLGVAGLSMLLGLALNLFFLQMPGFRALTGCWLTERS